jgi:hypothetical protein
MPDREKINNDAAQYDSPNGGVGDVETAGETTAAAAITGPTDTSPVGADTMIKVSDSSESTKSGEAESE